MRVLIVESNPSLGGVWKRALEKLGLDVRLVDGEEAAITSLAANPVRVIVLNLVLQSGSALAIADYASYRHPGAKVVFVTSSSFFSDGSIFQHCANACAFLPSETSPQDIAFVVDHHARAG